MDRFEEFKSWFADNADEATKRWVIERTGSDDVKEIYALMSSLKYVGDGRNGDYPCSLKDISIFRFFPQINGFFYHDAVTNGFRVAEELIGPTVISAGFETLLDLPYIREIELKPEGASLVNLKALANITSLRITGQLSGDLEFLRGWNGLQSLVLDKISKESFAPPNFTLTNLQKLTIYAQLQHFNELAQQSNLRSLTIGETNLSGKLDISSLRWLQEVTFNGVIFTGATLKLSGLERLEFNNCDLRGLQIETDKLDKVKLYGCQLTAPAELFPATSIASLNLNSTNSLTWEFGRADIGSLKINMCNFELLDFTTLPAALTRLHVEGSGLTKIIPAPGSSPISLTIDEPLPEAEVEKLCLMKFATLRLKSCMVPVDFPVTVSEKLFCQRRLPASVSYSNARAAYKQHLAAKGYAEDFSVASVSKDSYARDPVHFRKTLQRVVAPSVAFMLLMQPF